MDVQQKLNAFVDKVIGKFVGTTSGNYKQCVGLIQDWLSQYVPRPSYIWGNAKDLLANADRKYYEVIYNSAFNYPQPGDTIVWGPSWGDGYGHTAVVLSANYLTFTVLEQNMPYGAAVRKHTYTNLYSGVQGWIRVRKTTITPVPSPTPPPTSDKTIKVVDGIRFAYKELTGRDASNDELNFRIRQMEKEGKTLGDVIREICEGDGGFKAKWVNK